MQTQTDWQRDGEGMIFDPTQQHHPVQPSGEADGFGQTGYTNQPTTLRQAPPVQLMGSERQDNMRQTGGWLHGQKGKQTLSSTALMCMDHPGSADEFGQREQQTRFFFFFSIAATLRVQYARWMKLSPVPPCCHSLVCSWTAVGHAFVLAVCRSGHLCSTCSVVWSSSPQLQIGDGASFLLDE